MMPTTLVLTFNQALDRTQPKTRTTIASSVRRARRSVRDRPSMTRMRHRDLAPGQRIDIHYRYELIADGTVPGGLTNLQGQLLDGTDSGEPGSDYRAPSPGATSLSTHRHPRPLARARP